MYDTYTNSISEETNVERWAAYGPFNVSEGTWDLTTLNVNLYLILNNTTPATPGNVEVYLVRDALDGIIVSSAIIDRTTLPEETHIFAEFTWSTVEVSSDIPYYLIVKDPQGFDDDSPPGVGDDELDAVMWRSNPATLAPTWRHNNVSGWFANQTNRYIFELNGTQIGGNNYAEGTKTVTVIAIVDYITGPGKAWNPGPTDDQEDITIIGRTRINTLTWTTPTNETPDFLVYYRAEGGAWVLQETITDDSTSHTLSSSIRNALSYYSIYEWRVDTREAGLTTTGDTWTFITQQEGQFTDYTRRSDYDADKVWQPGTGWVDPNTFEYTGGGRYKGRVLVVGHQVIYFGDL